MQCVSFWHCRSRMVHVTGCIHWCAFGRDHAGDGNAATAVLGVQTGLTTCRFLTPSCKCDIDSCDLRTLMYLNPQSAPQAPLRSVESTAATGLICDFRVSLSSLRSGRQLQSGCWIRLGASLPVCRRARVLVQTQQQQQQQHASPSVPSTAAAAVSRTYLVHVCRCLGSHCKHGVRKLARPVDSSSVL